DKWKSASQADVTLLKALLTQAQQPAPASCPTAQKATFEKAMNAAIQAANNADTAESNAKIAYERSIAPFASGRKPLPRQYRAIFGDGGTAAAPRPGGSYYTWQKVAI